MESGKVGLQLPRTRFLVSSIRGLLSSKCTPFTFPLAVMDTSQPIVAFNGLGMNLSSAKALIKEYDRELSEVEALIIRVEDDKGEDERVLRSSKEAIRPQLWRQMDEFRAQESVELEQLEAIAQGRRASLDEKKKSIQAKIDAIKDSIAPIRKVPAEVLGFIFREVVALDLAPWLLTIVNKSWRRTALTNPWLWSNIHLGGMGQKLQSEWLVDGISRACCGNGLVCRNVDELAYFVDKSGMVPLDLQVYPGVKEWAVLHHLVGPHLSSRIRSLSIPFGMRPTGATGWIFGPLPLLQELSCGSTSGPFIGQVMARAHQLKDLKTIYLSPDLPKYPFWKTLRTLDFGYRNDASELNQVISELPLIEVIKGSARNWPNIDTPVVTLQHIKSIELVCHLRYIAHLRLPRLEELVWHDGQISYNFYEDSDFPTDPEWRLSLPNLVQIEMYGHGMTFSLALRELPNVQTALLAPVYSMDSEDPWALDLIQSLTGPEEILCPKLRHLTLIGLQTNKTLASPLIRRLIISRKALGMPFEHFEIGWAEHEREVVQYAQITGSVDGE